MKKKRKLLSVVFPTPAGIVVVDEKKSVIDFFQNKSFSFKNDRIDRRAIHGGLIEKLKLLDREKEIKSKNAHRWR